MRSNRTERLMLYRFVWISLMVLLLPAAQRAGAFPAFARKYNLPCARCHSMTPRLTPYGYAFYRAGFRLPNNPRKPYTPLNMLSALTEVDVQTGKPAVSTPGIDGVLATSIEKNWAVLARYTLSASADTGSGFDDLWAQFNSGARGGYFSLRAGQLPVLDGYQLLGDRNITLTDAMLFGANGPLTGAVQGNFAPGSLERGVQFGYTNGGFNTRVSWLNGINEAGAGNVSLPGNRFHDVIVQSEYLIGNEGTAIGGFYYYGKTPLVSMNYNNNFERAGLFGTYSRYLIPGQKTGIPYLQAELNGGLLWGQDTVAAAGNHSRSYGTLIEADLYFLHRTALAVRYDMVRPSDAPGTPITEAYTYALLQRASSTVLIGLEYRKQRQPSGDSLATAIQFFF